MPVHNSISFSIEQLAEYHDRQSFCCGNEKLDNYFRSFITQDSKRNIANPYVIFDIKNNNIIGYYTLSVSGVDREKFPLIVSKKLPKYSLIGVILIGRLAVSKEYKGCGWGKILILDSLYRSLEVNTIASAFAVIVEAIDEDAVRFYQKFNFQIFSDKPYTLFQKMSDVIKLFRS